MPRAKTMRLMCGAGAGGACTRHDGVEHEAPLRVRPRARAPEAAEARIRASGIGGMGVAAFGVGLPDLDQGIVECRAGPVEQAAADADALAGAGRVGKAGAGDAPEGVSVLLWRQPEGEERADGLRRRLLQRHLLQRSPSGSGAARAARCRTHSRARSRPRSPPARSATPAARALAPACRGRSGRAPAAGRPGKYICVMRRVAMLGPNSEKWMCAGRQPLAWLPQG